MSARVIFAKHSSPDQFEDRHTRDVARLGRQLDRDQQTRRPPPITLAGVSIADPDEKAVKSASR